MRERPKWWKQQILHNFVQNPHPSAPAGTLRLFFPLMLLPHAPLSRAQHEKDPTRLAHTSAGQQAREQQRNEKKKNETQTENVDGKKGMKKKKETKKKHTIFFSSSVQLQSIVVSSVSCFVDVVRRGLHSCLVWRKKYIISWKIFLMFWVAVGKVAWSRAKKKCETFFLKLTKMCPSVKIPFNAGTEPMKYDEQNICNKKKTNWNRKKNSEMKCVRSTRARSRSEAPRDGVIRIVSTQKKDVFLLIISKNV